MQRELRVRRIRRTSFEYLVGRIPHEGDILAMFVLPKNDLVLVPKTAKLLQMWTVDDADDIGEPTGDT